MSRDTFKAKGEPYPMELTKEQKEALKWVYQFVHDLADPESPTYEDLGIICETAQEMKVHVELNFATDIFEGDEDE